MRPYELHQRTCGAVMIELLLVLPVVMLIISLLFFFGTGMMNLQRSSGMDRYAVWRSVANAPGPSSAAQLNQTFFHDDADDIDFQQTKYFPDDVANRLVAAATMYDDQTGNYTQALVNNLPSGQKFSFQTTHHSNIPLWQRMADTNQHAHVRFDNEWKYANGITDIGNGNWVPRSPYVTPASTIRDVFFTDFDDRVEPYINSDNGLARLLRDFYVRYPAYRGP
jgi:hypothetical protein